MILTSKFYDFAKNDLFKLTRSLTGKGTKKKLIKIKKKFPKLKIYKVRSGTKIFDWRIPDEWNIKDAYIIDKYKKKIIVFKKNNLHIVGYSKPLKKLKKNDLLKKIYSHQQPDAIPMSHLTIKKIGFLYNDLVKRSIIKII